MVEKPLNIHTFLARCLPIRGLICIMMFSACWTTYMCRLQMPILIVPMIVSDEGEVSSVSACMKNDSLLGNPVNDVSTSRRSPDVLLYDVDRNENLAKIKRQADIAKPESSRKLFELFSNKPFQWSSFVRGQLLAAYSYGNVPGNIAGSIMALKFGPRIIIFWSSLITVVVSFLSPFIANCHWIALLVSRAIIGFTGGIVFPACHTLVAKWAPPNEKSRFIWSLLGGTFGTIFTYPMIAFIAESINWETAWYLPSLLMLIWTFIWYVMVYDSPMEHPGITDKEKNYIINAQTGVQQTEKIRIKNTPLKSIFTSLPFLCLVILHFGNIFLLSFYQNSMMLYLTKVLGFQLTKGGLVASLPWLARISFGFAFSWIGDTLKKREILSITALRKCATIFSHFLPCMCLVGVGYVGCSFLLANIFLFLALGFNGAASIANLSNNQDLSPNYAGVLYGIMNTIGFISGMIIPSMVEVVAGKHGNTIDRWQIVFWIAAAVCLFCMLIFIVGGSGNIQSWNEKKENESKSDDA